MNGLEPERHEVLEKIGDGGFSEVFRVRDVGTGDELAMKKIRLTEENRTLLMKEMLIHQQLKHPNIIKCHQAYERSGYFYIIQELAVGGELFELVEPDCGFPEQVVHFYFVQLMQVVQHLQSIGICHRDLKLENMLLDGHGNLKVSDFGLSTVYRKNGVKRELQTKCGTLAYMAPEVACSKDYDGDLVDLWSSAIILIALFCGNLPWDAATKIDRDFVSFVKTKKNTLIDRIPQVPRALILDMLRIDPSKRVPLQQIISHPWVCQSNPLLGKDGLCCNPNALFDIIRANNSTQMSIQSSPFALTQPLPLRMEVGKGFESLSQPDGTDGVHVPFLRNNFARICCQGSLLGVIRKIEAILKSMLVPHKLVLESQQITFQTVDSRKCPLTGTFSFQTANDSVLIIVRKNRGNPLEYARFFKYLVDQVHSS